MRIYLQAIASLLNDGHTTLLPDTDNKLIYPFALFEDNQKIYLIGINKEYSSFLGKQILQINGNPVIKILSSFKNIISSDNDVYLSDKINNYIPLYSTWKNSSYCMPDSSLRFVFTDSTKISLRPIPQNKMDISGIHSKTATKKDKIPFKYQIIHERSLCYLQFNSCMDQSSLRFQYYMNNTNNLSENQLEKKILQYPRFDKFLNNMFEDIHSNKIKTLVIDVRNNTGGNSKLCDILLSWLKPIKDIRGGSSSIRFSELWKLHYMNLYNEYYCCPVKTKMHKISARIAPKKAIRSFL